MVKKWEKMKISIKNEKKWGATKKTKKNEKMKKMRSGQPVMYNDYKNKNTVIAIWLTNAD